MLGFYGAGNMATAILRGVLSSGLLSANEIAAYDLDGGKTAALAAKTGITAASSPAALIESCSTIVLAVKPQVLPAVLKENAAQLEARVVRVMPNLNAAVGAAVSAFCGNENTTDSDLAFAEKLCKSFGSALSLPESQFPIFGVLGGCAPAFVFLFIDALAAAGVKNGLTKDTALSVSAQTVLGSAKLLLEGGEHPRKLIDAVCSPGGTTIEGVLALQKDGFETAVHDAVQAALEKDRRL